MNTQNKRGKYFDFLPYMREHITMIDKNHYWGRGMAANKDYFHKAWLFFSKRKRELVSIILIFIFFRIYTHFLSPIPGVSWWEIAVCGFLEDIIFTFLLVYCFYLTTKYFPRFSRFVIPLMMLTLITVGLSNSIFMSWSRFPISLNYFHYLFSMRQLWFSVDDIVSWSGVLFFLIPFLASLVAIVKIPEKYFPNHLIYVIFSALLILSAVSRNSIDSSYFSAVSRNIFFFLIEDWLDSSSDIDIYHMGDRDFHSTLITTGGRYKYLDEKFPLVKIHMNFGQRKPELNYLEAVGSNTKRPNIILIFMESFRSHDIGVYGRTKRRLTPNFDKISKKGLLWRNFYANSVQTSRGAWASLASIYPHLGKSIAMSDPMFPIRGLPSILREQGYRTEYYHNGSLKYANKM